MQKKKTKNTVFGNNSPLIDTNLLDSTKILKIFSTQFGIQLFLRKPKKFGNF